MQTIRYMTTQQPAAYFQVHQNTVYTWRNDGMPCIQANKALRYDLDAVEAWMKERIPYRFIDRKGKLPPGRPPKNR